MHIRVTKDRWFRRFGSVDPGVPTLVCFPHAGGSAGSYSDLAAEIVPALNVVAVQYPGHLERFDEPFNEDISAVGRHVATRLVNTESFPLLLFGHSMGGLVAFESARELAITGASVKALFLSACAPPQHESDEPRWSDATSEALARHLADLGGMPPPLLYDSGFVELLVSILRSDYRAIESYVIPRTPQLRVPITALYGRQDPTITRAEIEQWTEFSNQAITILEILSGHFYDEESLRQVAQAIRVAAL